MLLPTLGGFGDPLSHGIWSWGGLRGDPSPWCLFLGDPLFILMLYPETPCLWYQVLGGPGGPLPYSTWSWGPLQPPLFKMLGTGGTPPSMVTIPRGIRTPFPLLPHHREPWGPPGHDIQPWGYLGPPHDCWSLWFLRALPYGIHPGGVGFRGHPLPLLPVLGSP